MRLFSWLLFGAAALVLGLAVLAYVWMQGMGCAFVTSGECHLRLPWQMGAEDRRIFVYFPLGLAAVLGLGGWLARR